MFANEREHVRVSKFEEVRKSFARLTIDQIAEKKACQSVKFTESVIRQVLDLQICYTLHQDRGFGSSFELIFDRENDCSNIVNFGWPRFDCSM